MNKFDAHNELDINKLRGLEKGYDREWQVYLAAVHYVECGYRILPNEPNSKRLPTKKYNISYVHASRSRKTIDDWFHPGTGKFKGWNIGIACGREDGVFAIDIDNHGVDNGFNSLDRLQKEHSDLPPAPCQETPNDGKHYLFRWQENAANTTNKIAPGIDTRGGDATKCKGHITVWPSIVNKGEYKWVMGGELPDIPVWVMSSMGTLWTPSIKYSTMDGRGNENISKEDYETIVLPKQIKRMLSFIDIDDLSYEDWLRVGMAIKSQHPGDDGLEIWDNWSKGGTRHKGEECNIRWYGFSISGSVRAGTLFYHAKKGGWEIDPIVGEKIGNKFDELVAKMNEQYAIVMLGGKTRIALKREPQENMDPCYIMLEKDSFKTLLENEIMRVVDESGKAKFISVANIWLAHQSRRTYIDGMGVYPKGAPPGRYNTWRGLTVEPRQGECGLFLSHIKDIICYGNEKIYKWVMDWLADLIQDPGEPKGCAVVMRGGEGAGKGTFANTIGELFGPHYCHLIDDSHLTSNFNAHIMEAIVVFADEVTWGGNKKSSGKLKGMVTEKHIVGERKGVDALIYRNRIHMLIASNGKWLIPAGEDSRRWLVLDVLNTHAKNQAYFASIRDELNNGGKEALLYHLLNVTITSNLYRAPVTEALVEQREMSIQDDTVLRWWGMALSSEILDIAEQGEFKGERDTDWPEYVRKSDLYANYENWCMDRKFRTLSMNVFYKEARSVLKIKDAKVTIVNNKIKKRIRVFWVPTVVEARKLIGVREDVED